MPKLRVDDVPVCECGYWMCRESLLGGTDASVATAAVWHCQSPDCKYFNLLQVVPTRIVESMIIGERPVPRQ